MASVKQRQPELRSSYEQDFYAWATSNARLLRAGRLSEVDAQNIAEELETMGRSERELMSRLSVLLAHLLKWQCRPERRSESWRNTIESQREDVLELLDENPSLRRDATDRLDRAYRKAKRAAAAETGMSKECFPKDSPFSLEQAVDETFWPI